MDLFDFVISELFGGKVVDFFHFDDPWWKSIFPFADLTLKDEFIGATVSDEERAFSRDLIVESVTVPLINESGVDFFEFGFGGENFLSKHDTEANKGSVGLALAFGSKLRVNHELVIGWK